jgi:hypothetical protein
MHRLAAGLMTTAFLAAGPAQAASVELRDLAARVTVIPEARSDLKVEFLSRNPALPITLKATDSKVVLDGRLDHRIRGCSEGSVPAVTIAGLGDVAWKDLPQLVIRTPRAVQVLAGGAVFGVVGRTESLDLSNAGCGDWTAGNVKGVLKVNLAGSGDAHVGASGAAHFRVAGSGDIVAGPISGPLEAEVAGSGDVSAVSVAGDFATRLAGSGDVSVPVGHAGAMTVSIAGSGDVAFGGTADSLKARITGSGEVRVRRVTGPIDRRVLGSGEVRIDGR